MAPKYGFLFHIKVCKVAKALSQEGRGFVTIPNIIDILFPDVDGKERQNSYQRILMFMRSLEKEGIAEKEEKDKEVSYQINFNKINI